MAQRLVETNSIHSSTYHTGWIRVSRQDEEDEDKNTPRWEVVAHNNTTTESSSSSLSPRTAEAEERVLPCAYLDLGTHINMHGGRNTGGRNNRKGNNIRWQKDVHFHENLKTPNTDKGILVLFEAMASEGVALALSPQPSFEKGSTVEITFGAVGNTKTTILRRKQQQQNNHVSVPCRVCHEGTWIALWVATFHGKVYAGMGNVPGEKCLAFLNLRNDAFTSSSAAAAAAAADNPTSDDQTLDDTVKLEETVSEETMKTTNDAATTKTTADKNSNAMNNINFSYVGLGNAAQQRRSIKIRHLHVTTVPSFVAQRLESMTESDTMDVMMDQQEELDDEALKQYQEQCRKAKARAQKFGIEYKEPSLAAVVPWSKAKKLRENPQKGFITGIDITDAEEKAKQEARKSRFGLIGVKRELEEDEVEKVGEDDTIENVNTDEMIPPIKAWDNEELVRFQRLDPPNSLWKNPPEGEVENETIDEFAMETDKPTISPEKVHVFSIDWAAFKQIRSEDLMAHFTIYGPSYVEWLSDLGCNIHFEDKFSAVRAIQAMAQDIPSPPPAELNENDDEYVPPDLGAMGWKIGKKMVKKIKNDRFGRRGTTARILMRPATSLDILFERVSHWPEPPPGFSTKRILGPGSDYNTNALDEPDDDNRNEDDGSRRKRRRRSSGGRETKKNDNNRNNRNSNHNNNNSGGKRNKKRRQQGGNANSSQPSAADLLNQGLSSSRAGFSVEELDAMRASKKNATSK